MDFEEGQVAETPEQVSQLEAQGFTKCHNQLCNWYISPQAAQQTAESGQRYTCPHCGLSYDLNTVVGKMPTRFTPGGTTIAGITLEQQSEIGESLVRNLGEIPGYGQIVWWQPGPAAGANAPLDGRTQEWGIEVKTVNADAANRRFVPGSPKVKGFKNTEAADRGLKGILGILVLLNYRQSLADIYVMEMPLDPWTTKGGRPVQGVVAYRHHNGTHLVAEVPFQNPLIDPKSPSPNVYGASAFAQQPHDDIPF